MDKYSLNETEFGTHCLIAKEIGSGKRILDIGCNEGYFKKIASDNHFYGIDINSDSLRMAKELGYEEIERLNLNNYAEFKIDRKFEVILFADILEHLVYPEKVLAYFVDNYLQKDGRVIISLPNVANFMIRLRLLFGNFDYSESGILDKTHLHLYTQKTARELIKNSSLRIIDVKYSSNNFGRLIKYCPWLGNTLGFNLIFVCRKE